MKILLITNTIPLPQIDGLHLRTFHIFKSLAERHTISLFCLDGTQNKLAVTPLKDYFRPSTEKLRKEAAMHDCCVLAGYRVLKNITEQLKNQVVDLVDDPYLHYIRAQKFEKNIILRLRLLKWAHDQAKIERQWRHNYKSFIVSSPFDAGSLRRFCPDAGIEVVANGVDGEYFRPSQPVNQDDTTLVFSGKMDYAPNEDAMIFAITKILPKIKSSISSIKLIIVGSNPTTRLQRLAAQYPSVIITGFVSDIRTYIQKASIYICPLRWGTGVKNKILEAWAMSKPIVASPISCEGLATNHERNILIANQPKQFASEVIRLLENDNLRKTISANGRKLVESEYSWEKKAYQFEEFLKKFKL